MWKFTAVFTIVIYVRHVHAILMPNEENDKSAGIPDLDDFDSNERVGAAVTQIVQHPFSGSLLKNGTYVCSCVILNTHWLLTAAKCFDSDVISSYVTYKKLGNYTVRTGSSYNNKGGSVYKVKMLINNFDMEVSAIKLQTAMEFGSRISAVNLPTINDEDSLGYLASIVAWTPSGHIRVVNAPLIAASLCESYTNMLPGNFVCLAGVEDPNRHFCREILRQLIAQSAHIIEDKSTKTNINLLKSKEWKNILVKFNNITSKFRTEGEVKLAWKRMKLSAKANLSAHKRELTKTGGGEKPPSPSAEDLQIMSIAPHDFVIEVNDYDSDAVRDNGGAVIQNNTLVGIATFIHTCAVYTKIHAFPKVAAFSGWLDSVIWDEETRPTAETTETQRIPSTNATETPLPAQTFADPRNLLLTIPFDPINVPLEPAEDNSVIPRMSLYEAYLANVARAKTSTTQSPKQLEMEKTAWLQKLGKAVMMMPQPFGKKYDDYDYS